MTTLYTVSADDVVQAADINQFKSMLEGASGYTSTFKLVATANTDFVIKLGDAAAGYKLVLQDSAGNQVAYLDSDGNLSINGTFSPSTLQLPVSASPSQTTDGVAIWDSDDNVLTVGDGASRQTFYPGYTGLSSATRTDFRANRRRVGEWNATGTTFTSNGFGYVSAGGGIGISNISGEPVNSIGATGTAIIFGGSSGNNLLSPNNSPRMLLRVQIPAASANVTFWQIGFPDSCSAAANGAYLRVLTTGNVFFVTRQGGSETTTDLGALSRTTVLGFEIETVDAGVTWVCRNQAGTVLATHTTNVPTAATGLNWGFASTIATAGVTHALAYMVVEGTFS